MRQEEKQERHPHIPARDLLDRLVLGGSDGAIEGLAMTSALNGAGVAFQTIALAGLAFAVAGAISMFFSSYLARRSELESIRIDMTRERMEIETEPDEERRELADLLKEDGYSEQEVEVIMGRLVKNKDLWLREMLRRELKINSDEVESEPYTRSLAAGTSFFVLAILAVVPYAFSLGRIAALSGSVALSLVALFALGSRLFVPRNFRPRAGLESAAVGALAGSALYALGLLVSFV